jgi:hypothetical protein
VPVCPPPKVSTVSEARNPNRVRAGINQGTRAGVGRVTGTTGRRKPATPAKVTPRPVGAKGAVDQAPAHSRLTPNVSRSLTKASQLVMAKPKKSANAGLLLGLLSLLQERVTLSKPLSSVGRRPRKPSATKSGSWLASEVLPTKQPVLRQP